MMSKKEFTIVCGADGEIGPYCERFWSDRFLEPVLKRYVRYEERGFNIARVAVITEMEKLWGGITYRWEVIDRYDIPSEEGLADSLDVAKERADIAVEKLKAERRAEYERYAARLLESD